MTDQFAPYGTTRAELLVNYRASLHTLLMAATMARLFAKVAGEDEVPFAQFEATVRMLQERAAERSRA